MELLDDTLLDVLSIELLSLEELELSLLELGSLDELELIAELEDSVLLALEGAAEELAVLCPGSTPQTRPLTS